MRKPKIVAHTLVKNEARWVWFALQSALPFVDEIIVWDTGSTDGTPEIVSSISSPKIKFKEIGVVDPQGHSDARQKMLDITDSDWILVLDGDEIWWWDSLHKSIRMLVENTQTKVLISPFINLIGDIYHFQSPERNFYQIGEYKGAFNLRFIKKLSGLHLSNPHGRQEYRDGNNIRLQDFPDSELLYINAPYLHTTHLPRSVSRSQDVSTLKRDFKYRYELGNLFNPGFLYPEVLYLPRPDFVPNPWFTRPPQYLARSLAYEPLRLVKKIISSPTHQGY